jgi:hypothetical protein
MKFDFLNDLNVLTNRKFTKPWHTEEDKLYIWRSHTKLPHSRMSTQTRLLRTFGNHEITIVISMIRYILDNLCSNLLFRYKIVDISVDEPVKDVIVKTEFHWIQNIMFMIVFYRLKCGFEDLHLFVKSL